MLKKLSDLISRRPLIGWLAFFSIMLVVFLLGLLAASITERRAEIATLLANRKIEIQALEGRNDVWGVNYPRQYQSWKKTALMDFNSKYNSNHFEDLLEQRPNMVVLWAGLAFAIDYNAPRGHMYAVQDLYATLRTGGPETLEENNQKGNCWTCKSSDFPRMIAQLGVDAFYSSPWSKYGHEVVNPIGCADCHDPETMKLTITRPALIKGLEMRGMDVSNATVQEMRSLVCAQCHVEYYFSGPNSTITFPWKHGFSGEDMEKHLDEVGHNDWVHALSRAPMIKPQHPDYEIFLYGTHAKKGVSCADCHMPYMAEGGIKFSSHHITSPLRDIGRTCLTCHRDSEDNLRALVYGHQDKLAEIRDILEPTLVKAHLMAKHAWDNGATEAQMAKSLQLIRQAQWRWDFVVASHGAAFHAPVESQRLFSHALDRALQAQIELYKVLVALKVNPEFKMPDISTKDKAQAFIGLDMKQRREKKQRFLDNVVPGWLKKAKENNRLSASL